MADMGFLPSVRRILDKTAKKRQTLLFSATLDGDVATLARNYQRDPVRHDADGVEAEHIDASHHFWLVDYHDRVRHTANVVESAGRAIVFTRTRRGADRLAQQLSRAGVAAVAMHGGLSQNQRNRALRSFSSHRAQALVATDVAARGIHIDSVESVIHFDPPGDHKDYLHRSGRTARAGASGMVVSMVAGNQRRAGTRMQRELGLEGPIAEPRLSDLGGGGIKMGERVPAAPHREEKPSAPGKSADRKDRRRPNRIYVANLPWSHNDADLEDLFAGHGKVHAATVITDRRTGRSKGFGFVDMPQRAARRAIAALHGHRVGGRDLTVRFAEPSKYRS